MIEIDRDIRSNCLGVSLISSPWDGGSFFCLKKKVKRFKSLKNIIPGGQNDKMRNSDMKIM